MKYQPSAIDQALNAIETLDRADRSPKEKLDARATILCLAASRDAYRVLENNLRRELMHVRLDNANLRTYIAIIDPKK